jgi:glycosyltransferase involved in cell wall biosynthesis
MASINPQSENRLRIAIDATNLSGGGGLTVGLRLWEVWARDYPVELFLWYSRDVVREELDRRKLDSIDARPFMVGAPSWKRHFWGRRFKLGPLINKVKPDVLIVNNSLVGRVTAPQVVHQHNLLYFETTPIPKASLARELRVRVERRESFRGVARADASVYVSEYIRQKALAAVPNPRGPQETVYNPISPAMFKALADRDLSKLLHPGKPNLISVTSPMVWKNNPTLFEILGHLRRRRPDIDWRLTVLGIERENFLPILKQHGVEQSVDFVPWCPPDEIGRYYRDAFALVFPSVLESFGIPPLEAMAFDCPSVVSNCSTMPEVVADAGLLATPGDGEQFAQMVEKLWDNRPQWERLVRLGHERIGRFSPEQSAREMFDFLQKIVNRGKS